MPMSCAVCGSSSPGAATARAPTVLCPRCWTTSASPPSPYRTALAPALHAAVAAGEAVALGSAPAPGLIARPLTPRRRVRFALIWRDETPAPTLRELIASAQAAIAPPSLRVLKAAA